MSADIRLTEYGAMSSSLKCSNLSDLCVDKVGVQTGPFGSQLHKEDYVEVGTPIITVEHLGDNRIVHVDTPFVSDEDKARLSKYHLEEGDIVFSRVGSVDRRALVRKEEDGWLFSGRCLRVRVDKTKIDPVYLSYFFGLEGFKNYIRNIAVGATMPSINTKILSDVPIYYPECLEEQRKIANIFYTADDKIELNRQTNQTLEHIAQAIFKSWFVDFEPTRAKIAAKQTGQDPERAAMVAISGFSITDAAGDVQGSTNVAGAGSAGATSPLDELDQLSPEQQEQLKTTAALFPDTLVESELGEMPEGWNVGTLNDLCSLNEKSWTKKNSPDDVLYVDLANTKNGIIEQTNYYSWEDAPSRAKRILSVGDTIFGTVRPGNRSFSYIGKMDQQLTASTGFAVLTPSRAEYSEFVYIAATNDESIERLAHLADGGAYPAVRPDVVTALEMVVPGSNIIEKFHLVVLSLFDKRSCNLCSEETLELIRDALLPKLLSGEMAINSNQTEMAAASG